MITYHVDRRGSLREGQIVNLLPTSALTDSEQRTYVSHLFGGEGVSKFGSPYTRDNRGNTHQPIEWFKETIFEYVRRLWFPHQPSRFQSFFSVRTYEDVVHWIDVFTLPKNKPLVWEVEVDRGMELDAAWRDLTLYVNDELVFDPARTHNAAMKYWSGEISPTPRIEFLSPLPVHVVREIVR